MAKRVITLNRLLSIIELNNCYEKISILDFNEEYYLVKFFENNSNYCYEMLVTKKRI